MAQLSNVRRIVVEDYSNEDRELVDKLATILNSFMEEVVVAFDGNIDFNNLKRRRIFYDLTVGSTGNPINNNKIQTDLGYVYGMNVVKVENLTNPSARLTQCPFIDFSYLGSGLVQITYVTGLTANNKYRLTLEVIG